MHNLLRYIRQNRKKIIKVALIVAFLIILLQILNYLSGKKNGIEFDNSNNSSNSKLIKETNGTITSDRSAVSGSSVSIDEIKKVGNKINEFVDYCNNGKVEEAYNLLSNSCKEVVYPSVERFKEIYYKEIFNGQKIDYTIQNWSKDIYIVKFKEDLLATGRSGDIESHTDYITIVEEDGQKKLNISNFIGKEEINKENEKHNIKVKVLNRLKYMEYEIYEIEVTNNTNSNIFLNAKYESKGMYIKDDKDNRHYSFLNEIIDEDLKVLSKYTNKIKIKFDNPYIESRKITNLCFPKIILDYKEDNYGASYQTKVDVNI